MRRLAIAWLLLSLTGTAWSEPVRPERPGFADRLAATFQVLNDHLLALFDACLKGDPETRALLEADPKPTPERRKRTRD